MLIVGASRGMQRQYSIAVSRCRVPQPEIELLESARPSLSSSRSRIMSEVSRNSCLFSVLSPTLMFSLSQGNSRSYHLTSSGQRDLICSQLGLRRTLSCGSREAYCSKLSSYVLVMCAEDGRFIKRHLIFVLLLRTILIKVAELATPST